MLGIRMFCIATCLVLLAGVAPGQPAADAVAHDTAPVVGGNDWFVCAALMTGKYFFIGAPAIFLTMAIAGGLACGFGV